MCNLQNNLDYPRVPVHTRLYIHLAYIYPLVDLHYWFYAHRTDDYPYFSFRPPILHTRKSEYVTFGLIRSCVHPKHQ